MEINWLQKRTGKRRVCSDASVKIWKNKRGCINFHSTSQLITKTGYMLVGWKDSKMFFKEGTRASGYKIQEIGSFTTRIILVDEGTVYELLKRFKGDYPLHQAKEDPTIWYLDLNEKI